MTTPQSRATLAAFKTLQRVSGVDVTLRRGVTSGTVKAVPGDTLVDTTTEDGQVVRMRVRDYIVLRTDFEALFGGGEEPERKDEIDEVIAGYTRTYKVADLGGETFRFWDKSFQVLRIHTVEAGKVTTTTTTTTTAAP